VEEFALESLKKFVLVIFRAKPKAPSANDDENIVASARFATDAKYVNENASIRIVECHRQVVAGLKYDMKVEVTNGSNVCKVEHYEVWDRFGEKRVITSETLTSESCAN